MTLRLEQSDVEKMRTIELDILVEPTAKARPRISVMNGHAMAYTPAKTRHAETAIQFAIREQLKGVAAFPAGVPLEVEAVFYRPRPKSLPKRVIYPVQKPDADNYCKLLLDALNHYLFADDSQIVDLTVKKRFAVTVPYIHLVVREVMD